ncbi:leucine-rich repeat-containing protein 23-like [Convolutriloba macropyga]|uniref:leucine-rich repeat-containing protein 23-like n=1 Tax=Convolutriloba macropyga TaxID=536237 RepID=UPI003F527710
MSKPLTLEVISQSISLLCKIGTGLAHAYVRLDVHDKELTNITMLSTFVHLRYIDISMNSIKDISPLNCLTHMLTLKSDRNLLASPALAQLPYLQSANFAKNKIIAAEGVDHPLLETLHLSYNKISSLSSFATLNLTMLHTLELRSNQLRTTKGLVIPTLRNLYLAQNVIKYLEDVDKLCNLQLLHMRDNHIEHLDGFSENNRALQYLNLRSNHVTAKKEIQKLKVLPMLRCVVMAECPISDEDDYRVEVLIALRKKIERLDKDEYTEEERQEAEEISEQRRAEENPGGLDGQDADDPLLIDDDGLGGEPGSNEEGNDFDIDDEVDYS